MCTAFTLNNGGLYFGRTLDNYESFGEEIVIMPRDRCIELRSGVCVGRHYAIIGMAHVADGIPLYYDGMNEKGLCAAALRFPSAHYERIYGEAALAHFEVIAVLLAKCASVSEAVELLQDIGISDERFSSDYPLAPLHWLIADSQRALVLEPELVGLKMYDNPIGVLTNEPSFDVHLKLLSEYMSLSPRRPSNNFSAKLSLSPYSYGMGAIGLPGDNSSRSRFVRCAFNRANIISEGECKVSDFFKIASSVEQIKGTCVTDGGEYEKTVYTSCCDTNEMAYCYTSCRNRRISMIKLEDHELDGVKLIRFPCICEEDIFRQKI